MNPDENACFDIAVEGARDLVHRIRQQGGGQHDMLAAASLLVGEVFRLIFPAEVDRDLGPGFDLVARQAGEALALLRRLATCRLVQ